MAHANHIDARCVLRCAARRVSSTDLVDSWGRHRPAPSSPPVGPRRRTPPSTPAGDGKTGPDLRRRRSSTNSTAPTTPDNLYVLSFPVNIAPGSYLGMTDPLGTLRRTSRGGSWGTSRAATLPCVGAAWQDSQHPAPTMTGLPSPP